MIALMSAVQSFLLHSFLLHHYQFTIATELSLDMFSPERQNILANCKISAKHELKPDIALYYAQDFDYIDPAEDVDMIRMEKVPLLCTEVVSPSH